MTWPCRAHEGWHNKDCLVCTGEEKHEQEIAALKAEVESYKRAKAENDERFQLEAGVLRQELAIERERNARLVEALMEIEKACPIIEEMSYVQLIKADGDDFLFRSTNRRRKIARQALLSAKQDETN